MIQNPLLVTFLRVVSLQFYHYMNKSCFYSRLLEKLISNLYFINLKIRLGIIVWSLRGFHFVLFKTVVPDMNNNCLNQLPRLLNMSLSYIFYVYKRVTLYSQNRKISPFYNFCFVVQSALPRLIFNSFMTEVTII